MTHRLLGALLILWLLPSAHAGRPLPLPELEAGLRARLSTWLVEHGRPPEEYVLSLFGTRQVVCLGEHHRIRHDALLVQELVRRMPAAGVEVFAWEFARREDQPLIDSLMAGPAWDEPLAREILFRNFVFWGYQDYQDILRAAWETNRARGAGAPALRVLGINDSPDWTLVRRPGDWQDSRIRRAVWQGGGERVWARTILGEVDKGRKVLVHCGIHHAFSAYGQPIVDGGGVFIRLENDRMGQHLRTALGDRVATVYLHAPWPGRAGYDSEDVRPVEGVLDALMAGLPAERRRFGFDTRGTPLGDLPGRDAVYSQGHDGFVLADFCDGYACHGLFDDYQGVRVIPGFVNKGNLERARPRMPSPESRGWSAGRVMRAIRDDADPRGFSSMRTLGAPTSKRETP